MNRICTLRLTAMRYFPRSNLSTAPVLHQRLHDKSPEHLVNPDEPIKYFGSEAAKWKAQQTRQGAAADKDTLWYQPYVVMGSLMVFMIYFCVLREESDVDGELNKSLYDRVDGLEEIQLKIVHKYNEENKIDNSKVEGRMKELAIMIPKY